MSSLDSAAAIARISPFLRRHRPELDAQLRVLRGMDLATRNLRVISRRIDFLVRDGVPRPGMGSLIASLATSVTLLGQSLDDPRLADTVRVGLVAIAERLRPETVVQGAPVTDSVIILMLRPLLVDLLGAADLPADKARAVLQLDVRGAIVLFRVPTKRVLAPLTNRKPRALALGAAERGGARQRMIS